MFSKMVFMRLDDGSDEGIGKPPPGYVAPLGSTPRTWPNIYRNMQHMDFCKDQFDYLANRMHCITIMTKGPFLD
jgi:hypothetical protein